MASSARLTEEIDTTREFIEIQLDSTRNRLIKVNLIISTVSMSLAVASCVSGIFGMNLTNNNGRSWVSV
jgi:magnesium transporter